MLNHHFKKYDFNLEIIIKYGADYKTIKNRWNILEFATRNRCDNDIIIFLKSFLRYTEKTNKVDMENVNMSVLTFDENVQSKYPLMYNSYFVDDILITINIYYFNGFLKKVLIMINLLNIIKKSLWEYN